MHLYNKQQISTDIQATAKQFYSINTQVLGTLYLCVFWCASIAAFWALPAVRQLVVNDAIRRQLWVRLAEAERMNDVPADIALHQLPL